MYDLKNIFIRFDVSDQYVRAVNMEPNSHVCDDSCVEFFVTPANSSGYFNFEVNAAGTAHASYIEDARRLPQGGFAKYRLINPEWFPKMRIGHSLNGPVYPEIDAPTRWVIAYQVPFALFEEYAGMSKCSPADIGSNWTANFYKCGDATSHPHWGGWQSVGDELNFHQPDKFGALHFES